jgi:hypothetical protein
MAREAHHGESRFDLIFVERASGRIEADELKTGVTGPAIELPWVREQLRTQLLAGQAAFGKRFSGVRLVDLPRRQATLVQRIDD